MTNTFEEFSREFELNERDLIFTEEFLYRDFRPLWQKGIPAPATKLFIIPMCCTPLQDMLARWKK